MTFENLVDAYAVVIAATALVCAGIRWHLLRGPERPDAGTLDGERVAYLTGGPRRFAAAALAVQALVALALAVAVGVRPGRYRSVHRELRRLAGTVAHLRPAARPALRTYGPASAALAVGLFGAAAMTAVDPQFAVVAAGVEVEDPEAGDGTASGCGGCGCGGCGG